MKRLTIATLIALTATVASAQVRRMSGGGELSPTVAVTWEGWDGRLDLRVLWRGTAGWLQTAPSQGGPNQSLEGPGYPMRVHAVTVRGRRLELRVDENNIAHIQDQSIPFTVVDGLR